ncbi:hypothetical protein K7472_08690 [Streptomyces sp. PTM05]|uniref:Integral membrane protein n=1 Tax=Streptantibioticus parmotrematis TaxID=2873249 RepID=A0ABS7QRC5_9ACTN|nr:hypothetical protein [Streptantibioticus parmotrematis]MBY8884925.1 hypothetical protein [Streptantibioticus parmotrematis]
MGIESDKLVFDYLSRVGDLAQITLPAAERMRLVAQLRNDIDRARDGSAADSPAAVRRILGRFGTPDDVVAAAATTPREAEAPQPPQAPAPRPKPSKRPPRPEAPGPQAPASAPRAEAPGPVSFGKRGEDGGRPASGAGGTESGPEVPAGDGPEWWRVPAPRSATRTNDILGGGWTGGIFLSEFDDPDEERDEVVEDEDDEAVEAVAGAGTRRPFPRLRLRRRGTAAVPDPVAQEVAGRRGLPVGPLELLGALALLAGAVLGNGIALGAGWVLAYTSRGMSRRDAKFAALGAPGLVALGAVLWLWGRTEGRWGAPIANGQLGAVISSDFPTLLRVAAVASALALLWRASATRRQ